MTELDENGNTPQLRYCRVYMVSGFFENRPFRGLNIWTDSGPVTQQRIEAYETFRGWATEALDVHAFVENTARPSSANEFRVGLMASPGEGRSPYPVLERGGETQRDVEPDMRFLGWITPTLQAVVPAPTPKILMRFRRNTEHGMLDGLYVTTQAKHSACIGRRANFGRQFGAQSDMLVDLASSDFLQLSADQAYLEVFRDELDGFGTVCGLNPLAHLV